MSAKSRRSSSSSESATIIDKQIDDLIKSNPSELRLDQRDGGEQQQVGENKDKNEEENVLVMVRCRPLLNQAERASGQQRQLIQVEEQNKSILVDGERTFQYDQVFGPTSDNERVYMKSARKLVEWAFKGYNCTIFLYGQTGTGKTHTHSSLTLSAFEHLFSLISDSDTKDRFLIRASYYELYNESIRDLVAQSKQTQPLELRESKSRGVYVENLSCYLVNNLAELNRLKRLGDKRRAVAATKMNEHSSRSHSIFSVTIETIRSEVGATNQGSAIPRTQAKMSIGRDKQQQQHQVVCLGRLNLIDLAGSERQSKSGSTGARLKEASRINLSLTCLSLVIRALTDKNCQHIPYRSSKLTRLLSSSLGGNSKTLLIACISPAPLHLDETLNTLRFASRTKMIKNVAKINEDPKDALLRNYKQQINELRKQLEAESKMTSDDSTMSPERKLKNEQLMQQLQLLKAKIMVGGENLLDKVEMHEKLLEASRMELEEKRQEELRLKQRLEEKRRRIEQMQQSKSSLESQRMDLDEKLQRVVELYRKGKEELRDLTNEHEQLKSNLLATIRATSKEIKYADCIIEDFIPREYIDLINSYARYDDESDEWQIKYIALSGNNMAQTRRLRDYVNTTA